MSEEIRIIIIVKKNQKEISIRIKAMPELGLPQINVHYKSLAGRDEKTKGFMTYIRIFFNDASMILEQIRLYDAYF